METAHEEQHPDRDHQLQLMADKFSATASLYATSEQRGGDDLAAVVAAVAEVHPRLVLDVATGPGSTALALAAVAERVLGTDVAPGMIDTARTRAVEAGLDNVEFRIADAVQLPCSDGEADALTCRIAAHHFADVPAAVAEMARVLRPGGRLVLLDSEAPADPVVARFLHEIELARDPTHVRAYSREEWLALVLEAGFEVRSVSSFPKPKAFEPWLERGGADPAAQAEVRDQLRQAPAAVVTALAVEYDDRQNPIRFSDDKVLVVADRREFSWVAIDHVQLAMPEGEEARAEQFYTGLLGLVRQPKPEPLASRGGCWFRAGSVNLHLGVEADFRPARKAHPALVVHGIDALVAVLGASGHPIRWSDEQPGPRRGHIDDPFGNRIELIASN